MTSPERQDRVTFREMHPVAQVVTVILCVVVGLVVLALLVGLVRLAVALLFWIATV